MEKNAPIPDVVHDGRKRNFFKQGFGSQEMRCGPTTRPRAVHVDRSRVNTTLNNTIQSHAQKDLVAPIQPGRRPRRVPRLEKVD